MLLGDNFMKKRLIVVALGLILSAPLLAKIEKDHVTNKFYSTPATPDINQEEFDDLLFRCWFVAGKIMEHPGIKDDDKKQTIADVTTSFLLEVGTPTAFRLLSDLRAIGMLSPSCIVKCKS